MNNLHKKSNTEGKHTAIDLTEREVRFISQQVVSKVQLHKQVLAKVNAYVDEDIKPLIEILNTLDKVWTFESCQRNRLNRGWVMLYYGDESTRQEEIISFAKKLIASVRSQIIKSNKLFPNRLFPILGDTLISIEWSGGDSPYLYINFPSDEIKQVTSIFNDIVRDIHESMNYK